MLNCLFCFFVYTFFRKRISNYSTYDIFLPLYISFSKTGSSSSSSSSESSWFVSSGSESFVFVSPGNFTAGKVLIVCILLGLQYFFTLSLYDFYYRSLCHHGSYYRFSFFISHLLGSIVVCNQPCTIFLNLVPPS